MNPYDAFQRFFSALYDALRWGRSSPRKNDFYSTLMSAEEQGGLYRCSALVDNAVACSPVPYNNRRVIVEAMEIVPLTKTLVDTRSPGVGLDQEIAPPTQKVVVANYLAPRKKL
jgi:hypothetical protein